MDMHYSVMTARGRRMVQLGGYGGEVVTEGDLTWVVDTIQCTDDVLWNCAPETCIILLTTVTPIHSIKHSK